MSGITLKESNPVDIPTPDAGKDTVFIDSTAVPPVPSYKNSSGVVTTLKGSIGVTGVQGPAGPAGFALDGDDGQFIISQPGPQGNTGPTGAQGPLGPVVFVSDGLDGEQGFSVPGPQGPSGAGGASDWDATITKAVDDTITNSATLTNDSELVTAALVSGGVYRFEFFIIYSGTSTAADYKCDFVVPAATSEVVGFAVFLASNDAITQQAYQSGTNVWPNGGIIFGTDSSGTKRTAYGNFSIVVNAASVIRYQFAQAVLTAANSVTTYAGSYIRIKRIA